LADLCLYQLLLIGVKSALIGRLSKISSDWPIVLKISNDQLINVKISTD